MTDWYDAAACRGRDAAIFYPGPFGSTAEAKAICATCTVSAECAVAGIDEPGIGGGMTDRERNGNPTVWHHISHGTRSGYGAHLRNGTDPCARCLEANREAARVYRRKLRASRR